jgi:hypothetical protein
MKYTAVLFFSALVLAGLACKTSYAPPTMEQARKNGSVAQTNQTAKEPEQAETALACRVKTGAERGVLHLRSCAGTACSVIMYLPESEPLTVLERGAWSKVVTVTGAAGYVNSKFIFCEMEKKENE